MEQDFCLNCETVFDTIVEKCPKCGQSIVYCSNPTCGMAITSETQFCPFCGTANQEYTVPVNAPIPSGEITAELDIAVEKLYQEAIPGGGVLAAAPESPGADVSQTFSMEDFSGAMDLPARVSSSPLDRAISNNIPFLLEHDANQVYRQHERGLLRFRLRPTALPANARVVVELLASPEFQLEVKGQLLLERLSPLETRLIPPIRCLPKLAGTEAVDVIVSASTDREEPLGRWQTSLMLRVTSSNEKNTIHVEGDIIDMGMGGIGLGGLLDPLGGRASSQKPLEQWQAVMLEPDAVFMERLQSSVPSPLLEFPRMENALASHLFVLGPWLLLRRRDDLKEAVHVYWGESSVIGRTLLPGEPDAGAHFHVLSDTGEPLETRRMSRAHAELAFRQGRAWIRDVSTNGTWLNQKRLTKGSWQLLAAGDHVSFRQVATFTVHLQADKEGVYAVFLSRNLPEHCIQTVAMANRALFWPESGQRSFNRGTIGENGTWFVATPADNGRRLALYLKSADSWRPLDVQLKQETAGIWSVAVSQKIQ